MKVKITENIKFGNFWGNYAVAAVSLFFVSEATSLCQEVTSRNPEVTSANLEVTSANLEVTSPDAEVT